jgi:hypothetical protein
VQDSVFQALPASGERRQEAYLQLLARHESLVGSQKDWRGCGKCGNEELSKKISGAVNSQQAQLVGFGLHHPEGRCPGGLEKMVVTVDLPKRVIGQESLFFILEVKPTRDGELTLKCKDDKTSMVLLSPVLERIALSPFDHAKVTSQTAPGARSTRHTPAGALSIWSISEFSA